LVGGYGPAPRVRVRMRVRMRVMEVTVRGWMDGWMDSWMDGWLDDWIAGYDIAGLGVDSIILSSASNSQAI